MRGVGETCRMGRLRDRRSLDQALECCSQATPQDKALKGQSDLGGKQMPEAPNRKRALRADVGEAYRAGGKQLFDCNNRPGNARIDGRARPAFSPVLPEYSRPG